MNYNRILMSQTRQKSYVDTRVRVLKFIESDHVWLRVPLMKYMIGFGKKSCLALDSLVHLWFWFKLKRLRIICSCHRVNQLCIMCFMSPCFGSMCCIIFIYFHSIWWFRVWKFHLRMSLFLFNTGRFESVEQRISLLVNV